MSIENNRQKNCTIISFSEKSKLIALENLRESLFCALDANIEHDEIRELTNSIFETTAEFGREKI